MQRRGLSLFSSNHGQTMNSNSRAARMVAMAVQKDVFKKPKFHQNATAKDVLESSVNRKNKVRRRLQFGKEDYAAPLCNSRIVLIEDIPPEVSKSKIIMELVGDYQILCYMQGCPFTPAFLVISFPTVEEAKKCALSLNQREITKQTYLRATLGLGHPRVYLWNAPANQTIDEMKKFFSQSVGNVLDIRQYQSNSSLIGTGVTIMIEFDDFEVAESLRNVVQKGSFHLCGNELQLHHWSYKKASLAEAQITDDGVSLVGSMSSLKIGSQVEQEKKNASRKVMKRAPKPLKPSLKEEFHYPGNDKACSDKTSDTSVILPSPETKRKKYFDSAEEKLPRGQMNTLWDLQPTYLNEYNDENNQSVNQEADQVCITFEQTSQMDSNGEVICHLPIEENESMIQNGAKHVALPNSFVNVPSPDDLLCHDTNSFLIGANIESEKEKSTENMKIEDLADAYSIEDSNQNHALNKNIDINLKQDLIAQSCLPTGKSPYVLVENPGNSFGSVMEKEVAEFPLISSNGERSDVDMFEDSDIQNEFVALRDDFENSRLASVGEISKKKNEPQKRKFCNKTCLLKCEDKFNKDRMNQIFNEYNVIPQTEVRYWLCSRITRNKTENSKHKYIFTLLDINGISHIVCKPFFMASIGRKTNSDAMIRTAMKAIEPGQCVPQPHKRGKTTGCKKVDELQVLLHIESYNPDSSHYRREHAPNRRYLSLNDIGGVTAMHQDYNARFENSQVCYETYRKLVRQANVSFAKLGSEECEQCKKHELHATQCTDAANCNDCLEQNHHRLMYGKARKHYESDRTSGKSHIYTSDLQKVVQLPKMPSFPASIFCQKLNVFNATFSPIGRTSAARPNIPVLWHDGISGRSAADLASAYWRFFYFVDSAVDLIVWADNCTAQQKNYLFFTTLIQAVNHFRFKKITIKFLKRGHTAMKSDSVHAGIEREVRKRSNVYDFESFIDVVEQANSGFNKVLVMKVEHFKDFANGMRQRKPEDGHPPIAHFVKVEARKGSRSIFYALDHEDEIFVEMDLLREGISLIPPSSHISQKGVSQGRKHDILKNCCPLMPEEYRKFWNELSISEPEKTSQ